MRLPDSLHGRKYRNAYRHSVRIFSAVGDEHSLQTDFPGILRIELENLIDRRTGRDNDFPADSLPSSVLRQCQSTFHRHFQIGRKSHGKPAFISCIKIFRLHEGDLERYCDHHLPAQCPVAHLPVVSVERHYESGQFVRSPEFE